MKLLLKTLFTITCILFCAAVQAQSSGGLAKLLDSITTMRANFTQTVYDNKGRAIQKSYGKMALQRPGKFRWEVLRPISQLVIANNSRLWIYDPDLQQVTIRSIGKVTGETPALLLSHVNTVLDKDFIVKELAKKTTSIHWYSLTPKNSDSMFKNIQLGFVNNQINQMRLADNLGHNTVIQYNNIQTNISIPAAVFTFKPPANVDVIDETSKK